MHGRPCFLSAWCGIAILSLCSFDVLNAASTQKNVASEKAMLSARHAEIKRERLSLVQMKSNSVFDHAPSDNTLWSLWMLIGIVNIFLHSLPYLDLFFSCWQGLNKEWKSLKQLVTHHTVMAEMLPCTLRLPTSSHNPAYRHHDDHYATIAELDQRVTSHAPFRTLRSETN